MQHKRHSFLEAVLGTAIGFLIALCAQLLIFPQFGIEASMETNLSIAGIMTVVSIIRSYFVRRLFNHLHTKGIL
jgi:branched-subunit amino acid transport protein